jgi:cell division protein FtsW
VNQALLFVQLTLMGLGLVGVAVADLELISDHATKCLAALAVTLLVARIKPTVFTRFGPYLWGMAMLGLVLALFIGHGPNGVRRWITLGPMEIQPAELAKPAMISCLASFLTGRATRYKLAGPLAIVVLTTFLILVAPSVSAAGFTFVLGVAVMFASGVGPFRIFAIVFTASTVAVMASSLYLDSFGYVAERFIGFLDLQEGTADPLREGYQNYQALRVLEQADLWGQGLDTPLPHLPAAHTDFIVISVVHATGLLGFSIALLAYLLILRHGLHAARFFSGIDLKSVARDHQVATSGAAVLAAGATIMLIGQAIINLGVAVGALPNTGIALPMMSYGGSHLIAAAVAFGWIHAALREGHREPAP